MATDSETPVAAQDRSRRIGQIVVALALVVGIGVFVLTIGQDDRPDPPEMTWIEMPPPVPDPQGQAVAGPKGFVRPAGTTFQFSADGETWSDFDLARGFNDPSPMVNIARLQARATDDVWLIESLWGDHDIVWVSSNGTEWTRARLDEQIADSIDYVIPAGPGFYGMGRGKSATYWWSNDGLEWIRNELPFERPGRRDEQPIASSAGITWITTSDEPVIVFDHSVDGTTWFSGELHYHDVVGDEPISPSGIARVSGTWLFTATVGDGTEDATNFRTHVWTSPDGVEWEFAGVPSFTWSSEVGELGGISLDLGDLAVVGVLSMESDGTTFAYGLWATRDGVNWDHVFELDWETASYFLYFAARRNENGSYTGIYPQRE